MDDYEGLTDEELFSKVLNFLEEGDLVQAQTALDAVKVSCGRKYFLQGKIFLAKSWHSEAKNSLNLRLNASRTIKSIRTRLTALKKKIRTDCPNRPNKWASLTVVTRRVANVRAKPVV